MESLRICNERMRKCRSKKDKTQNDRDGDFYDFLEMIFAPISCPDLNNNWKLAANKLCTTVFELTYSIPRTSNKDISLDSVLSYKVGTKRW